MAISGQFRKAVVTSYHVRVAPDNQLNMFTVSMRNNPKFNPTLYFQNESPGALGNNAISACVTPPDRWRSFPHFSFKLFDNCPKQTRGKRISNLP
jgi:hypothetical protein